ncbi:MAG: ATP-dependent sacrificial sulfur transferase LarE [Isosphaeraceae bacterium]
MNGELASKHQHMQQTMREMGRLIVAFSAGVDSTLVLKVALDTLGKENVIAATGVSPSLAARELNSVKELAGILGANLMLLGTSEMDSPQYTANPSNRCYFCKSELYTKLGELASKQGGGWVIVNGVNADDKGDWRPGLKAADEHAVRAPLLEAGMTKSDVRTLAKELGVPNWEKPALACLSSRIPYGTPVTLGSLGQIEKAEAFLWDRGFKNFRVRHHQKLARVEVAQDDLKRLFEEPLRTELLTYFKNIGYTYVTVDLHGFRSGSGNEVLTGANRES